MAYRSTREKHLWEEKVMRLNHIVAVLAVVACLSLASSALASGACCGEGLQSSTENDICDNEYADAAACQSSFTRPTIFQDGADCCTATSACIDVPIGACCFTSGCINTTSGICSKFSAVYHGDGTTCDPTPGLGDACPSSTTFCSTPPRRPRRLRMEPDHNDGAGVHRWDDSVRSAPRCGSVS